jgi:hypothetical protein
MPAKDTRTKTAAPGKAKRDVKAAGNARKAARIAAQNERAAKNREAGVPVKVRRRPKRDNMRLCLRCAKRSIVAGSVCWCKSIGADLESLKNRWSAGGIGEY